MDSGRVISEADSEAYHSRSAATVRSAVECGGMWSGACALAADALHEPSCPTELQTGQPSAPPPYRSAYVRRPDKPRATFSQKSEDDSSSAS